MTFCNMTIFSKTAKYEYLQYEYFSKKIVIFDFKNMTKKKTYGYHQKKAYNRHPSIHPSI